jgi:hypothetical protein
MPAAGPITNAAADTQSNGSNRNINKNFEKSSSARQMATQGSFGGSKAHTNTRHGGTFIALPKNNPVLTNTVSNRGKNTLKSVLQSLPKRSTVQELSSVSPR